jgi:hypothetical protein
MDELERERDNEGKKLVIIAFFFSNARYIINSQSSKVLID